MGKFNIHRFIKLLTRLGIYHSVLFDGDNDKKDKKIDHKKWNKLIENSKTEFTTGIHKFTDDLETFLGIKKQLQNKRYLKPIHLLLNHEKIPKDKIDEFREIIEKMVDEKIIDEKIVNEEIIDEEIVDKEIVDKEIVDKEIVDKEIVDKEIVDVKKIDKEKMAEEEVNGFA